MAMCEKCSKTGYDPKQMFIDHDAKSFIGPCCTDKVRLFSPVFPMQVHLLQGGKTDEFSYRLEISNKVGVKASVGYGGLQVVFERNPQEIRDWAEKNGLTMKTA